MPRASQYLFHSGFLTNIVYACLLSPMCVTHSLPCPQFDTLIIFVECKITQFYLASCLVGAVIFLSTQFPNILGIFLLV